MSRYYILNSKIENDSYFAEKGKISDQEIIKLYNRGVSLKDKNIEISLYKNRGNILHFIDNLFSLPIVSEVIVEILKGHCVNEIEYFPVKVNMKTNLNYFFINILNNVSAIDYDKSQYVELAPDTKVLEEINKLVLDDTQVANRHVFRLNGFKLVIFISEKLKNKLEELNLQELEFVPVEEYKWKLGYFGL